MKKYILFIILIIFAVTVAWILRENKKTMKSEELLSESSVDVLPVNTKILKCANIQEKFTFSGILRPVRELIVISQTQGEVKNVFYELGDFVKKGSVIVQVDNEMLVAQIKVAEANYEKAKKDIERFEKMAEIDGVTRDQLEKMQLNFKNAEAQYLTIRKSLDDTSIKASFDGYINQMFTKNGSMLGPGGPVFEIVDISGFKMTVKCSADEISHIKKGKDVRVIPKLLEKTELSGYVSKVSVSADIAQQFSVEISINQPEEEQLKGGMIAVAEITGAEYPGIIAVSKACILNENGDKYIFRVIDMAAIKTEVTMGITVMDMVEIKSGLKEGDQIVTTGINLLTDGQEITIVE
jgi:RND family efflux transporter MFP subunit